MLSQEVKNKLTQAAELIKNSEYTTAFTGAGISVESGISPFRGENGLWSKIDPIFLDMSYFFKHPDKSWQKIKEIFYDSFAQAEPNAAHYALAELDQRGLLHAIITQNIDNLHQRAGSKNVIEYHGTTKSLTCTNCGRRYQSSTIFLSDLPPKCESCSGLLKPDFVFFGEPIPELAQSRSLQEAEIADVFILIGTTGEVQPASMIPMIAKNNGTQVIEINIEKSNFTNSITDIFLEGRATEIMRNLLDVEKKLYIRF